MKPVQIYAASRRRYVVAGLSGRRCNKGQEPAREPPLVNFTDGRAIRAICATQAAQTVEVSNQREVVAGADAGP